MEPDWLVRASRCNAVRRRKNFPLYVMPGLTGPHPAEKREGEGEEESGLKWLRVGLIKSQHFCFSEISAFYYTVLKKKKL